MRLQCQTQACFYKIIEWNMCIVLYTFVTKKCFIFRVVLSENVELGGLVYQIEGSYKRVTNLGCLLMDRMMVNWGSATRA